MIIKDVYGGGLRLLKDRLQEARSGVSLYPYHAFLADIKKTVDGKRGSIRIHGRYLNGDKSTVIVGFSRKSGRIGCRAFSPETFAKILKAAGVKPVRKTKAKKGKK